MISVNEFSKKIKTKYPEYKDIDDLELTNKIIEKYPEYKEEVDLSQFQAQPIQPQEQFSQFAIYNYFSSNHLPYLNQGNPEGFPRFVSIFVGIEQLSLLLLCDD